MKVLILDNTRESDSFGSPNLVRWTLRSTPAGSEISVRRSPDGDLPPIETPVDALLISGSLTSCMETSESWIESYDAYVTHHLNQGTPILGICYGHQTLARCISKLKGVEPKFRKAKDAELGWQKIEITGDSALLDGLNGSFYTYQSHYEEVYELPSQVRVFARSDRCEIQAFQYSDQPVFGVQFHPEYPMDEAERSIARKVEKGIRSDWILNPGLGSQLFDENVGKVIFGNFFRIANRQ